MERPQRKHPRLKNYDYAQNGCYYVTVCVDKRQPILGRVVPCPTVGRGAYTPPQPAPPLTCDLPPRTLDVPAVELSPTGKMVEKYLKNIGVVYQNVTLDEWMIMPDHLHFLIIFTQETPSGGVRALRPTTLHTVVRSLKTMVTRDLGRSIWQSSYYERVIRNETELLNARAYIATNPVRWAEKHNMK